MIPAPAEAERNTSSAADVRVKKQTVLWTEGLVKQAVLQTEGLVIL